MANYRFSNTVVHEITSSSDLLALSAARNITGNPSVTILRQSGLTWIPLSPYQMIHGANGKENLINAFGSASARTAKKAERIFVTKSSTDNGTIRYNKESVS